MDFLSDIEKEKIAEKFNSDPVLVEAVRKVLLATIYSNGTLRKDHPSDPLKNGALGLAFLTLSGQAVISDGELGADLRGLANGINLLEKGLKELAKITKKAEVVESPYNDAI